MFESKDVQIDTDFPKQSSRATSLAPDGNGRHCNFVQAAKTMCFHMLW